MNRHGSQLTLPLIAADDVASGSNPTRKGSRSIRKINRSEVPSAEQETVRTARRVVIGPHDFALGVNPLRVGQNGAGKIDRRNRPGFVRLPRLRPAQVRPHTRNRQHILYRRIGS